MKRKKHVVVVGRGIMGLMTALRLMDQGFKVSVIGECAGNRSASGAALGLVSVKGLCLGRDLLFREKLRGHARMPHLIRELESRSGRSISHNFEGVKECFHSWRHYSELRERIFHGEFTGCFSVQFLNRRDALADSAFLRKRYSEGFRFSGAMFYPRDGWFDPCDMLNTIEFLLVNNGVKIYENKVEHIFFDRQIFVRHGTNNNFVKTEADEIVLAMGSGLPSFLERTWNKGRGLRHLSGVILAWENENSVTGEEAFRFGRYGLRTGGRTNFLGSEDVKSRGHHVLDEREYAVDQLKNVLRREFQYSGLDTNNCVLVRSGTRVLTKDRRPVLGRLNLGSSGIWYTGALYKNGFDLAPLLASSLCRFIHQGGLPKDHGLPLSRTDCTQEN